MQVSTKAQIQIGETIAVILVFVLLMIFGLYWASTFSGASQQQQMDLRDRLDLLETAKMVMNMPEIQCSSAGVPDTACVDEQRIYALKEQLDDQDSRTRQAYFDRFVTGDRSAYKLEIHALSPAPRRNYEVFNFHQENPDLSLRAVVIPVALLDPLTNRKQFSVAILTQQVES